MAWHIARVADEFQLREKISWLTLDNYSANGRAVALLFRQLLNLNPRDSERFKRERRCRCWDHIINSIVHGFLSGNAKAVLEAGDEDPEVQQQLRNELELWQKRTGPVRRAHQISVFIKASPRRIEAFQKLTAQPEFAPDETVQAEDLGKDLAQEPSACDTLMAPSRRPTDPTDAQTGDVDGLNMKMAQQTSRI